MVVNHQAQDVLEDPVAAEVVIQVDPVVVVILHQFLLLKVQMAVLDIILVVHMVKEAVVAVEPFKLANQVVRQLLMEVMEQQLQ